MDCGCDERHSVIERSYYIVIAILYLIYRLSYYHFRYCGLVIKRYRMTVYVSVQPQSLCIFVN